MKKPILLLLSVIYVHFAMAQCMVGALTINTGFDPVTGSAIAGSINGGTPVIDPHWLVTAITDSVDTAITKTPIAGLIGVVPVSNADVITPVAGWATNPSGIPGGWISCLNSNTYNTNGITTSVYEMTLSRPFRMCIADSIVLDLYIANDNYVAATNIDGASLPFSQAAAPTVSNYSAFTHFTRTVYLSSGTHTINIVVNNYNTTTVSSNPTGLNVYGNVYSKTGTLCLVSESSPSCASYVCHSCQNVINLPDTLRPCLNDIVTMPASIAGSDTIISYLWTPPTGLSSTTILTPVFTAVTSEYYYFTLKSLLSTDLVVNGDFSAGNTGFFSSYIYSPPPSSLLFEGYYSIYTDPKGVHGGFAHFGDHTTGTGNMMIINGSGTPLDVWCETISVIPNTDYDFSAWFANATNGGPGTYPLLQFRINGALIGSPVTVNEPDGVWVPFSTKWNSGPGTITATICIYDATTALSYNDFVIDDISFKQICTDNDSTYVDVTMPDTTYFFHDTSLCTAAAPFAVVAPSGFLSYTWNTGSRSSSISAIATGQWWVYDSAACYQTRIDTFHVKYIANPVVRLGNDTTFCNDRSMVLSSVQPVGYTYLWSTGSTGSSITVLTTGTYILTVNDSGCTGADTINVTVFPHPVVDLGPDYLNCSGKPDTLASSVSYVKPSYLWSNAATTPTVVAATTGQYWLQVTVNGCSSADTVNATIKWDTLHFYNRDSAICHGAFVQVSATGDPSQTYQWTPTAGIPTSTVVAPLIIPDTSATYILTASLALCPDIIDSFHLDVQPMPGVYIGDNRVMCQFDSIHINAAVTPNWYTHYLYKWTPEPDLDNTDLSSVVFTAGSSTQIRVAVYTPAGCLSYDSMDVVVHPGNFARPDTTYDLCPGDSVWLAPSGGVRYTWTPGLYLDDSLSSKPWVKAITSQRYAAIATSSFGCKDTLSINVNIHPSGVISMGGAATIYPGESYQISPQTNCVHFSWTPSTGLDDAHNSNPVAGPVVSTNYTVHASTEWGCKVIDSVSIYVDPETILTLPNAFTPGGGINKDFMIIKRGMATLKYFRIYNRWGNKVFETSNIDIGWDGTFNGTPQPFDVYVYEVDAVTTDGTEFKKQGNVTLVR